MGGVIKDVHDISVQNRRLKQREVYDLNTLCAEVEAAGFRIIGKGSFFIKPFTHTQMDLMEKEGIIDEMVLEGLWGISEIFPDYGSEIFVNIKKI